MVRRPTGITLLGALWILSSFYELAGAAANFHNAYFFFFISLTIMFLAAATGVLLAKSWSYSLGRLVYPALFVVNAAQAISSSGYILTFVDLGGSVIFSYLVYSYFKRVNVRDYFQQA